MAFSHFLWEISIVFMHYMPDKKLRHSHVRGYWFDWLTAIIVNHNLVLTHKFKSSFLIGMVRVRLPSCHTFVMTAQPLDWHPKHSHKPLYWRFQCECQAVEHAISKLMEVWIASWCCFPHWQCTTDSGLLHSRQNRKQTKGHAWNWKWWQFTHLCVCVYTYGLVFVV